MRLLTEQELLDVFDSIPDEEYDGFLSYGRAIYAKVIEKIKAQGPAAWAAMSEEGIVEALGFNQSRSRFTTPLYRLPEGD